MKTIAIYPGSFNPFHIGHLNIVEKAERIFGKGNLIICFGINPDKVDPSKREDYVNSISEKCLELESKTGRKVEIYSGFLHDFIIRLENQGNNVVVIRGLRNGADLDYEVNQMRFINDYKKNVNVVYITCDKEFEHISSSAIRKIADFGGNVDQYLIK
jgi:pantetheine-phosphate adenylyltransferase